MTQSDQSPRYDVARDLPKQAMIQRIAVTPDGASVIYGRRVIEGGKYRPSVELALLSRLPNPALMPARPVPNPLLASPRPPPRPPPPSPPLIDEPPGKPSPGRPVG